MLLCLSSGFTERYRRDVLRAASMPNGAHLRFRYQTAIVEQILNQRIAENSLQGAKAYLAYIDRTVVRDTPIIVPCREAVIVNTQQVGDFCVLTFCLQGFASAPSTATFNSEIRAQKPNLPHWDKNDVLVGSFCLELSNLPASLKISTEISFWQNVIKSLHSHTQFATEPFFYFVSGIYRTGTTAPIAPTDNAWCLKTDRTYELQLVQFTPGETHSKAAIPSTSWISAQVATGSISAITTPNLAVDSGYDIKRFMFRTSATTDTANSMLSLFRVLDSPTAQVNDKGIWDFDLLFKIETPRWKKPAISLAIGILLAAQSLLLVLSNEQISNKGTIGFWSVVVALVTGAVTTYGLKK